MGRPLGKSAVYRQVRRAVLGAVILCVSLVPAIAGAGQKGNLFDDLFSVSFPSEKEGWACGRWGAVLHTGDGGKTWERQRTETDFTLSSIHFTDPRRGWAVGDMGTILSTSDGGKTWVKQKSPVPFFLMGVYFASPSKGWIVTERTHILSTNDGGKVWKVQFKDADYTLKALAFADADNGWAVGEYGYIYHTSNGGITWENQGGGFGISPDTGEIESGTSLFNVLALDAKTAWAVGIDGYVTRTVDAGKSWQIAKTGAPKTQLYCIAADRRKTIVIGGNGVVIDSGDTGKTWTSVSLAPPITYGWIYGLASRPDSGFVGVGLDGAIYRSEGSVWKRITY